MPSISLTTYLTAYFYLAFGIMPDIKISYLQAKLILTPAYFVSYPAGGSCSPQISRYREFHKFTSTSFISPNSPTTFCQEFIPSCHKWTWEKSSCCYSKEKTAPYCIRTSCVLATRKSGLASPVYTYGFMLRI